MEKRILEILTDIEREERVRILYACESGSRAWGFSSPDSDYDVRFIYVRPLEGYLTLTPGSDVIERMYKEENIDLASWDLRKALPLFAKSNPSFYEWIVSPIVYREDADFMARVRSLMVECFIPKASFRHYLGIAENHNLRYLEKKGITLKRFLYYFRSLLCCKWVTERRTPPPVEFSRLCHEMVGGGALVEAVDRMLARKREGKENDYSSVEDCLARYAEKLSCDMAGVDSDPSVLQAEGEAPFEKLNRLFRETALQYWTSARLAAIG